ncbi:hypothetical protein Taro_040112 [Colocasia esculenta]|uniref:Uncharacterized protein n=1 Tax=Colocasia esculenta TaxID=4460 RepID=A0A843W839_COLES|nr:hypothetical protein [Colocasia esculenta]
MAWSGHPNGVTRACRRGTPRYATDQYGPVCGRSTPFQAVKDMISLMVLEDMREKGEREMVQR